MLKTFKVEVAPIDNIINMQQKELKLLFIVTWISIDFPPLVEALTDNI